MVKIHHTRNSSRTGLLSFRAYCLACSALITLPIVPAMAQDVAEEDGASNNEIIVTAQRRAERLEDVPMSVAAISAEAMAAAAAQRGVSRWAPAPRRRRVG